MSTRVGVFGAGGRMGKEILRLLEQDPAAKFVSGVNRNSNEEGFVPTISELDGDALDVLIDFSLPESFQENLAWCRDKGVAFVCGTTNISQSDKLALEEAAKSIACLWAPNMSLGVNLVAEMLTYLESVKDFDFQIVESHHNQKIDAPSGTAKFLQDVLVSNVKSEIPEPLAIRGGGIFGVHEIHVMGEEETIKIEHTALNRAVFARGSIRAAKWLASQPKGLYTMANVLGRT